MALPLLTRAEKIVVDTVDISLSRDTVITDSLIDVSSDDPDWYVVPEIPEALRAPMRANTGTCLTDSILTFNSDSVLTETTIYEYDAANRAIRTIVWKYDATGILSTSSKQEYAYDASGTQIYTGTFAWDTNTNDWRGTAKSEFVYNEAHKMESNITYTWVNNTWLPSQALTYAYDAAGRETEFTTYTRNASANRLVPSQCRLQTWYNSSKKTLEINYTSYANGAWSAGTQKEYDYDSNGNQIEYTYYSSYSNGNWVGSTHELWTYNASNKKTYYEKQTWSSGTWVNSTKELWEFNSSNKQTLHEKYTGSGTDWTITLREISGYDAAGNNTLVENYSLTSNVWKGTKKEEYTFNSAKKKINTYKYKWVAADNDWVYNTWAVTDFDAAGNATETANYTWTNGAWKGNGTRTLKTYNSSKKVTEQITQTWPTGATDWINSTRNTTTYSGSKTTQEASYTWQNNDWVGNTRSDWHYNAAGQNDTIKTYTNNGIDWIYSNRTVNTYDSRGNNILTHNAAWNGIVWVMTSMNRLDVLYDAANRQILNATYVCSADSVWLGLQKDTFAYSAAGKTLYSAQYTSWENNDWVGSFKVEYKYDSMEHLLLQQRYIWDNHQWMGQYSYEYVYDTVGRLISTANYNGWNVTLNSWIGTDKSITIYNTQGQISYSIYYLWSNNNWSPFQMYTYIYDSQNRIIEQLIQSYSDGVWQNFLKYEKEYLGNILTKDNNYTWLNNQWVFSSRNESTYDSGSLTKLRRQLSGSWTNENLNYFADKHYFYSCDAPASNGSQPRTPTDIEEIDENNANYENNENNAQPFDPTQPTYNLSGQRVDPESYHGLVIQSGHTYYLP